MILTRCFIAFGLCLTLLLAGIDVHAGQDSRVSFDSGSQEDITKGIIDRQIRIMPQFNALNFGLGWFGNQSYYYEKSLSRIFFQSHMINAKITAIDFDGTIITLKLLHPVKGVGIIRFVFNPGLISRVSDEDIQGILQNSLGDENHRYVFANPKSRRYHLFSCLHNEPNGQFMKMSREEAENQNFQPGGFCFKKMVYLPDLATEREIEVHWLARLRENAFIMNGSAEQEILNRLGHQILSKWPFQLLGYTYSFHLIYSHRMVMMAIPTGKIFITNSLMDALEGEQEIEALLVRAIAHIENRHSLKQYFSKTNAIKNKQFLQRLTMATGSLTGIIAGPGGSAIKALGNVPFHVSSSDQPLSSGYEENLEKAADAMAALYFDVQQKDRRHLSAVIRKQQLADRYFNNEKAARFDLDAVMSRLEVNELTKQIYRGIWDQETGVRIAERAERAEQIKFRYLHPNSSFVLKKAQRLPAQLDIEYQSIIQDENKVMVYLSDKSLIRNLRDSDNRSRVTLYVTDKRGKHRFKLLKQYTTEDMWGARLTFKAPPEKRGQFLEGVQGLEIEIIELQGAAGKGNDRKIENFIFVKGSLQSENRVANQHREDS